MPCEAKSLAALEVFSAPPYRQDRAPIPETNPSKTGCRIPPSSVHSLKRTLQTSSGSQKCEALGGAASPGREGRKGEVARLRSFNSCEISFSVVSSKPLPTRATKRSSPDCSYCPISNAPK